MAITAFGSIGEAAVAAKIGLIYGSDDGNTETIAFRIQARLGEENVDV